ncbi:MAG: DUF445 domain-containing protein [Candidatus Sumerlaeota bacterium]
MDWPTILKMTALPLMGALTGYITNYIAVRMLFRPRRRVNILGMRFQGLIPRRRTEIAETIAETVHTHLISHEDIRRAMEKPEVSDSIRRMVEGRVTQLLVERGPELHPMARMFLTDQLIGKLRGMITDEVMQAMPGVTDQMLDTLEENLDFQALIAEKIEAFDLDRFEEIVLNIARRELRAIEILGGVLGFCIGLLSDVLLFI